MCKWNKYGNTRIDPCMRNIIHYLNMKGIKTLASDCGHGRYPMSIIVRHENSDAFDICSYKFIPRKTRFYKRDANGHFYIPEVVK